MKCYEKRHCSSVGRSISRAASPAVSRSVRQSFQTGPVQSSPVRQFERQQPGAAWRCFVLRFAFRALRSCVHFGNRRSCIFSHTVLKGVKYRFGRTTLGVLYISRGAVLRRRQSARESGEGRAEGEEIRGHNWTYEDEHPRVCTLCRIEACFLVLIIT